MKFWFILILLGLSAFRCQENPQVGEEGAAHDSEVTAKKLTGHWIWRSTEGSGIAGPYKHTAENLGNIEFLEFTIPNQLRIQHIINNEAVNEYYSYTISTIDNQYLITLYNNDEVARKQFIKISNNTITLSNAEPCCDNTYESIYLRAKDF